MENERPDFDIIVNREKLIDRILSPISRLSSKAVIVLDGNRLFALANMSNENNGQMFMLSDLPMEASYNGVAEMVLTGVSKMIVALKAVKSETVTLHYDGTGLDYRSQTVSFRVRLSSETVTLPFKKDKVLSLKPVAWLRIESMHLREFAGLLAGFPNLNQLEIVQDKHTESFTFHNTDRSGVTDEKLDFRFTHPSDESGDVPENFLIYNYIFRSTNLANLGYITMRIGNAFAMIVSENELGQPDKGCIRYILPKLKPKA